MSSECFLDSISASDIFGLSFGSLLLTILHYLPHSELRDHADDGSKYDDDSLDTSPTSDGVGGGVQREQVVVEVPDVDPELLQATSREAVDAKNEGGGTGERGGEHQTVSTSVVAEREGPADNAENSDEDGLSTRVCDQAARLEGQEPHTQAEAAKQTAQALGNFFEDQSTTTEDQARHENAHEIGTLDGITNGRVHDIDNKDQDSKTGQVCGGEENVDPPILDANQSIDDTSEDEEDSGNGEGRCDMRRKRQGITASISRARAIARGAGGS